MGLRDPVTGEYRLVRHHEGRLAFASVRVAVAPSEPPGADPTVSWSVDLEDNTSAHPDLDPDEVQAAMAGATDALDLLAGLGVATRGTVVHVVHVRINLVDTVPSAVRAAAVAATAEAFGVADRVEVVHDGCDWCARPRYPAASIRPSGGEDASA